MFQSKRTFLFFFSKKTKNGYSIGFRRIKEHRNEYVQINCCRPNGISGEKTFSPSTLKKLQALYYLAIYFNAEIALPIVITSKTNN